MGRAADVYARAVRGRERDLAEHLVVDSPRVALPALGLLAGRSHKAIAYATGRSERTVRQHAVADYEKSGLAGRAELAAMLGPSLVLAEAAEAQPRAIT